MHVNGSKLQISNIGDSRGIIGNIDVQNGNLCATPLTMDHKVGNCIPYQNYGQTV